eukprot:TRINITY_DN76423_c0_g1_i1.p1 TRINITY_DN76423_c0_g1~~TRINITY_DN76423_c0_g1_i1.p1  ORF type:complete len:628 (-),score=79.70 TRINITY_DN76423_c0_g1_i1:358-2241(-)
MVSSMAAEALGSAPTVLTLRIFALLATATDFAACNGLAGNVDLVQHDAAWEGRPGVSVQYESPSQIQRDLTSYGWCDCGMGKQWIKVWPDGDRNKTVRVEITSTAWIRFGQAVNRLSWICDGMSNHFDSYIAVSASQYLSVVWWREKKPGVLGFCKKDSGRIKLNRWAPTSFISSVPFTQHTEGYACFKIPALLATAQGSLLAFAEARKRGCGDFDDTDIVIKRSTDGGRTWGKLRVMVHVQGDRKELGLCGHGLVIGNVAPVQVRMDSTMHPGRILVPYTRNNYKAWITYSDDDGVTWKGDREIPGVVYSDPNGPDCDRGMSYFGLKIDSLNFEKIGELCCTALDIIAWIWHLCKTQDPLAQESWTSKMTGPWQFMGMGPPGSLQLKSGRILSPGYHSYIRGLSEHNSSTLPISQLYNNLGIAHVMISDDDGDTWHLGNAMPIGEGGNENQLVELANGSVLMNARSLSTGSPQWRVQSRSDDEGESFKPTHFTHIPQPFNGCQGSTLGPGGPSDVVYVAGPNPDANSILQALLSSHCPQLKLTGRRNLTIWKSVDGGTTYPHLHTLDPGLAAQTSLQFYRGSLVVLHEQSDEADDSTLGTMTAKAFLGDLSVLLPSRFVYREVPDF